VPLQVSGGGIQAGHPLHHNFQMVRAAATIIPIPLKLKDNPQPSRSSKIFADF
jgi:hypothetical protein